MKKLLLIATAALSAMFGSTASADGLRADWMAGKRGMMVHWLFAEAGQIDYYANGFDINKFMADFDATKSDYLIFTIGQNKGTYASPNAKLAELGIPSGCCATRDLVGEIAAAVHARGKKFIAYLPCEVNQNDTVKTLLGWSDRAEFQEKYCAVITEWATRWGTNLDGWWIDGFYNDDGHWASSKGFDQSVWATALRAGNPNAVVTLNPGLNAQTPRSDVLNDGVLSDYLAGEINSPSAINWTLKEFADGATCRTHFLMPIDGCWGAYWPWSMAGGANPYNDAPNQETMNRLSYVGQFPDPVVSESDLRTMIQNVFAVNGAVTINIGVNASGTLNPASVALLAKMPGGSESASADPGTTVESLIGSWSSAPMASDGSTFSTDGDLVYAYSTASADKTVNGITFKAAATPSSASADFEFAPAFNTTQNAESDGMSGDLETIAKLAWKNSEKTTKGYATMIFKGLTAGKRYCIQLYIHDTYCHNSAVFGPDAKSTVIYRSEENDPKSGKDWTCGGVFTGIITAKGTTHALTLNYPSTDRIELNALQVRCLGDEIVRPEDAPVAEESVINAKTWQELFPDSLKGTYLDTDTEFTLPYRQHSPTTADGVKYPLVIFLHGAGEVGTDNWKQVGSTANDVIPITKYAMKHGDAFVLAPQCPGADGNDYSMTWSGANWNSFPMTRLATPTQPMAALVKLITEFMANNPVDLTRIYVTGLSMGGFGTWDLASRMTTTFAAVMPCCGGADTNAVGLYRGQSIRFFHGSSDSTVVPQFSRAMTNALTQADIAYEYVEYSGCNHVDCWKKAYVDTEDNLEWLFGHIKGEEYVAPDHGDTTPNAPLSTIANGGWLGWKMSATGTTIVDVGTKVWAIAQNYSILHSGQPLTVNGVAFAETGSFGDASASISCDKAFSYSKDTFGTEGMNDGQSDFARMLKTGWEATVGEGPAQTYTLHGLTSGKTYLVQFIYHCAENDRAALRVAAPGGVASVRVSGLESDEQTVDENWRYGGTLIGVFTADGTEKSFTLTYSREACYILNAVQLREVTAEELASEPQVVYGTPTIGSVTPSVNGTTATLALANVSVGESGGCYKVWLTYAEDGETLGDETVALYSQQSASCAVEIRNLTAGKKYNYSVYVSNEGNVNSEKKSGSFTIPSGGSDPVEPSSGDESVVWTATPMDAAGDAFSHEGDPVFAFMRDRSDQGTTIYKEMLPGLYFNWIYLPTDEITSITRGPAIDGVDGKGHNPSYFMTMNPAFNSATDQCGAGGLTDGNDGFAGMLMRAWSGSVLADIGDDAGKATLTLNNLTVNRRYCLQIFIHEDDLGKLKGIKAPDGTIAYAGNYGDVTDCPRGSVLTCTFKATGISESFNLVYLDRGSYQMNAIQLRDLGAGGDEPDQPVVADPDTSWMAGSFGVSFHWTAKIVNDYGSKNWEQAVANFNVKNFADSVESFGAKHVIFTVAHAWQQLPCPCAALDSYISGRTTTRDLMKDIIDELTNRNIRVVFYYNHSCNHNEDSAWQAASGYNDITDDASMAAFGSKICSIVRELSLRYGDGVSAWWFDSATSVDDSTPWPNNKNSNYVAGLRFPWDNLFAAARAGNPHAAVAVNWDVGATDQHGLATDYLSGETEKIDAYGNLFPFAPEGFQDHIWTRMDSSDWFWQGGDVSNYGSRFTAEQLAWWKVSHRDAGRMATLNLVIDEAGNINPVVAGQLVNAKTIGKVWSQGRYDPTKWQAAPASSNLIRGITAEHEGDRSQYTDGFHRTPTTVLTDGTVPMSEPVAGANLTNGEKAQIFESLNGNVFTWTLAETSDIYGFNLYSRSTRSNNNGGKDGGNDAIVVSSIEVLPAGGSDWVSIGAPALSFGIQDGISGGALVARLADDSGAALATNVAKIRFTQGSPENGASLLVECEVIGCKAEGGGGDDDPDQPASEWTAIPMTSDGSVFSTEGVLVFAFARDRGDPGTTYENSSTPVTFNYLNSLTDKVTKYHPWQHGGAEIDGPYNNGLQPADYLASDPEFKGVKDDCGNEGLGNDMDKFGSILLCAWAGQSLSDTEGKATYTVKQLVVGHRYLVEFFVHTSGEAKTITSPDGKATVTYGGTGWQYGGVLRGTFVATDVTHDIVITYSDPDSYRLNAIQLRDLGEAGDDPEPVVIPVYTLTIPTKTGLVLDSVKTNGTSVAETEGVYSIVSNTEVTITFTAASGYELDGNDGVVVKTIESNYEFADADYPAVKEQGGGTEDPEDPVDPQPGELVNGRANMKGWTMKRISTASKVASEAGFGWTAADNPSSKSYSASESVMVFNEAQVVNTIQLFAPSSDMANMLAAFKVYGSDDGSSWSELLSVEDEADWFARECRYYTFRNETAYSHYKLFVVSTVSGNAAKLGVYNYYFAKPADPTTPWTYASGKLTRGDQQFTNVAKDANKVYLQYSDNCSNESLYDLDFTAGIVDGSGNPIDLPFVAKGFNSNKGITRLVAPNGGLIFAGNTYTLQDVWYLNEVDFGTALSDAGKGTFKQCYSLQYLNETDWNIPILQEETFSSCYNLCGDLVFPVLTNKTAMASSLIASVSFPNLEYFGNGNSYFGCFDRCASLRKIVLGPNLKKVNGGKTFGRLKASEGSNGCDIYWKSAPPEFTLPNGLFHEADKNVYTNYLPLAYKAEWTAFANNPGVSNCTLVLPETDDGVGTWTSGTQQVVKWWSEEPPKPSSGFILIVR